MNPFKFIWALWGALSFLFVVGVCIPAVIFILSFNIGKSNARRNALRVINFGSKMLMILLLIKVRVIGKKNAGSHTTYIVVSNHPSLLDPPVVAMSVPLSMTFLAKQELQKIPLFGFIVKHLTVTVRRGDKENRAKSLEALKQSLSNGLSIFIAPEGTRNKSGEPLAMFYDGAFKLALETRLPLLPVTTVGTAKLLSPFKAVQLSPGFVSCFIDQAIEIGDNDSVETLKEKVRNTMLTHL